ncbi:MAG: UvrB/UvrC motif-containing protein [Eubacteriales bacterium]|nr:UvrB/UvrC motif-containing protein [Eubacteriales bacterium]
MKCSHCNNRDANTHYKRVINGQKEEMYLCEECAKELGVMDEFSFKPFSMDSFFGGLLSSGVSALNSLAGIDRCPGCGASLNDIINNGRVGCAHCYDKFEDRLIPGIEKIHGKTKHIGKNVTYTESVENPVESAESIDSLKEELRQAIKEQRFEDAAVIRDKIKSINEEA